VSSGDCVSLGNKTNLQMSHHTISCTGTACGTALNTNATSTAGDIVGTGGILGCWANTAPVLFSGTNPTITDVNVDLAPLGSSCATPTNGLGQFRTITRAVVANATGFCIDASGAGDINDSIAHDCDIGIRVRRLSPNGTDVTGTLVIDNNVNIRNLASGTGPTLRDSTVRNPGTCNFANSGGSCAGAASVLTLSGTDFIDNTIPVNGTQVVPRSPLELRVARCRAATRLSSLHRLRCDRDRNAETW